MSWKGPLDESVHYEWQDTAMNGGKLPAIRTGATSCLHEEQLYVFCGVGAGVGRSSDVWRFDLTTKLWSVVATKGNNSDKPSKRDGHSTTDIGDGKVIIFGGQGEPSPNEKSERTLDVVKTKTWSVRDLQNDLFEFDCKTDTFKMLCPEGGVPLCRRGHSAIFLPRNAYSESQINIPHMAHKHEHHHHTAGATSPKKGKGASEEAHEEYLPIPENSLVVFGGSGMEVSKYIEAVYNDVWVYNLDSGRWNKTKCRGVEPKSLFAHRVVRVGHLMLVVGGITGTNSKAGSGDSTENQEVYMLNMKTLMWSHVEVLGNNGKPAKLNLHGHSLVTDPYEEGIAYLFGGKDTIDGKRAAVESVAGARRLLKHTNETHAWVINLSAATMSPLYAENLPETRYEHLTQRVGFEGRLVERPPAPKRKAGVRIEPIFHIFGGARTETQGLCDPVMHSLVRVFTYTNPELMSIGGGVGVGGGGGSKAAGGTVDDYDDNATISTHHTADASSIYTNLQDNHEEEDLRQPSIWEKRQQMDMQVGKSTMLHTPCSWSDLKLALSSSLTDKRSSHLGAPKNVSSPPQPGTRPGSTGETAREGPGRDAKSAAEVSSPAGLTLKQKKKHEIARLKALGEVVLPIVKGKNYKDAKELYFARHPAPVPSIRTYHASMMMAMSKSQSQSQLLGASQSKHA